MNSKFKRIDKRLILQKEELVEVSALQIVVFPFFLLLTVQITSELVNTWSFGFLVTAEGYSNI